MSSGRSPAKDDLHCAPLTRRRLVGDSRANSRSSAHVTVAIPCHSSRLPGIGTYCRRRCRRRWRRAPSWSRRTTGWRGISRRSTTRRSARPGVASGRRRSSCRGTPGSNVSGSTCWRPAAAPICHRRGGSRQGRRPTSGAHRRRGGAAAAGRARRRRTRGRGVDARACVGRRRTELALLVRRRRRQRHLRALGGGLRRHAGANERPRRRAAARLARALRVRGSRVARRRRRAGRLHRVLAAAGAPARRCRRSRDADRAPVDVAGRG